MVWYCIGDGVFYVVVLHNGVVFGFMLWVLFNVNCNLTEDVEWYCFSQVSTVIYGEGYQDIRWPR